MLGTRHCFNGIADSTVDLLSLRDMAHVVAVDSGGADGDRRSGHELRPVVPVARSSTGFALHNLASLPHISIAGACATATHGSGVHNGNLATAVSALEIVTADGGVLTLSREKDGSTFLGSVVNLGALGVVTKVTLDVQPTFVMRQDVYLNLPMAQVKDHFEDIVAAGYSVSLFTDWQKERVNEVWIKRRIEKGATLTAARVLRGAARHRERPPDRRALGRELHRADGRARARGTSDCPTSAWGSRPAAARSCSPSISCPVGNAVEAILAVERLRDHVSPHLMISELRTIDADQLWMSPCYKQPSLAIHFTWKQDWESVRKVLPMIERELAPFGVRPHWGKLFTLPPAQLQRRYEQVRRVQAAARAATTPRASSATRS